MLKGLHLSLKDNAVKTTWKHSQLESVLTDTVIRPEDIHNCDPDARLCADFIQTYHYIVHIWQ